MATIQRKDISHNQVSNLFWLATGLGLTVSLLMGAAAPAIAWFYGEPRLVPICLALAITPLVGGLAIQHQALLRRAVQLRSLSLIQVASTTLSYAIAIAVAWFYRSYWALVALTVSQSLFRTFGTWAFCHWFPGLPRRGTGVRTMVGFGANITGFSFVNYFARSGDNMLIGWWWGAELLGFYERAYKLMMVPLHQLNTPLSTIMIPALSRLNGQPDKYRQAYFQAVGLLQIVSCPFMAFVAVMAPQIVLAAFGPGYEPAGPILRWLAIAGFLQPLTSSLGWLYISQGRGNELMRWGLLGCSLIVISFALGLAWGPLGVARAYAVMIWLAVAPLAFWFAGAAGPVVASNLWRLSGEAALFATPTVVVSLFVTKYFDSTNEHASLAIAGVVSLLTTLGTLRGTRFGRAMIGNGWMIWTAATRVT